MRVKGLLFVDYVRMIRGRKDVDWAARIDADALAFTKRPVDPTAWYPMAVFEALGNAILDVVGGGQVELARVWGQQSIEFMLATNPLLVEPGNPVETFNRFRVLRSTYFDFEALRLPVLLDDEALVVIDYRMGEKAEEAACYQTLGFLEGLLEKTGATRISASFQERSWAGDARTALLVRWTPPD